MRIHESGPGGDGSPPSYTWVRHTLETPGRSRLPATIGFLVAALAVAAIGYLLGAEDVLGLGLMFVVLGTIALSYSISVRVLSRPVVTTSAEPGALSLRHRSVATVPTFLTFLVFSPPTIVIGYQNYLPEAVLGGIVGVVLTVMIPWIALLHRKHAFLHLSPDSIRVTTFFDDVECGWENVCQIRASDHRPGIDTVLITYANDGMTVRKKTRGFSIGRTGPEWEFPANHWGASVSSLLSTLICLHENPEIRKTLNETQLKAMLQDPAWAAANGR
ncbi:hypothetical protein [Nocardia sp. SSK8]|uniref:hypothetical protein n=1 Tax=Nocardia sp. SSK8 TaxID=3120154 RepID=UPI003008C390